MKTQSRTGLMRLMQLDELLAAADEESKHVLLQAGLSQLDEEVLVRLAQDLERLQNALERNPQG